MAGRRPAVAVVVVGAVLLLVLLSGFAGGDELSAEVRRQLAGNAQARALGGGQATLEGSARSIESAVALQAARVESEYWSARQQQLDPGLTSGYVSPLVDTPPPSILGSAFAIVEGQCGELVAGKAENVRLPPASLTKIITAMVVSRSGIDLQQSVTVNVSGSQLAAKGSSVMGIEPGMSVTLTDLLHGLMLASGNDAALALADVLGKGDQQVFVDRMNALAVELGLHQTHFSNPHGLDAPGLYSSAFDMARAGRAFLQDKTLSRIAATGGYRWDATTLRNGNKMLASYPGAYGVKIGYTKRAIQTIVVAARRDGRDLIVSVFGSTDRYADAAALLDWAFTAAPPNCSS